MNQTLTCKQQESPLNPFADQSDDDHDEADAADGARNCSNRLHQRRWVV
jgi:hypothetical protein